MPLVTTVLQTWESLLGAYSMYWVLQPPFYLPSYILDSMRIYIRWVSLIELLKARPDSVASFLDLFHLLENSFCAIDIIVCYCKSPSTNSKISVYVPDFVGLSHTAVTWLIETPSKKARGCTRTKNLGSNNSEYDGQRAVIKAGIDV